MMRKIAILFGGLATLLLGTSAAAQEPQEPAAYGHEPVFAPRRSLSASDTGEGTPTSIAAASRAAELTVGFNYIAGMGSLQRGTAIGDVVNGGVAASVGGAYRITPRISVGLEGEYQEYMRGSALESSAAARGLGGDVFMTYHFMPYSHFDPWLRLGTGYHALWTVHANAPNVAWQGFELARVAVGFDTRTSADVALGPMIGADVGTFLWDKQGGASNSAIADPRVSTFVYAGIQGRFEIGGVRQRAGSAMAMR